MNNFTKEELEDLQSCVRHYTWGDGKKWDEPLYPHLVNKIQSFIDNYNECKHTRTMTDTFIKCQDCNKVIGYDK